MAGQEITRDQLADLLNEDLSREYQAIIAYVVYSQVLKGAEYEHRRPARRARPSRASACAHLSRQIDYLGKMPSVTPKPVKTSDKARDMLKFDLDERNHCELPGESSPMRGSRRVRHGGADQRNSRAGAGPSDRFGHGSRRGGAGCQPLAQAQRLTPQ